MYHGEIDNVPVAIVGNGKGQSALTFGPKHRGETRVLAEIRTSLYENADKAARLVQMAIAADGLATPADRIMRSACLLHELSLRAPRDPIVKRLYGAYLDLAARQAVEQQSFDELAAQTKNFIEIEKIFWMKEFIARNKSHLPPDTVSAATTFIGAIVECSTRISQDVDRICGVSVVATFENFDADSYLAENADVRESIRLGGFADALDHFRRCGHVEKRCQRIFPKEA